MGLAGPMPSGGSVRRERAGLWAGKTGEDEGGRSERHEEGQTDLRQRGSHDRHRVAGGPRPLEDDGGGAGIRTLSDPRDIADTAERPGADLARSQEGRTVNVGRAKTEAALLLRPQAHRW